LYLYSANPIAYERWLSAKRACALIDVAALVSPPTRFGTSVGRRALAERATGYPGYRSRWLRWQFLRVFLPDVAEKLKPAGCDSLQKLQCAPPRCLISRSEPDQAAGSARRRSLYRTHCARSDNRLVSRRLAS